MREFLFRHIAISASVLVVQLCVVVSATAVEKKLAELIRVGARSVPATLDTAVANGELHFRDASGEKYSSTLDELVRWSTPIMATTPDEVLLVDGSSIRLKSAWAGKPPFGAGRAMASADTHRLGELKLPRKAFRAVFWRLPPDSAARQSKVEALLDAQRDEPESDVVLMDNGDFVRGTVTTIGPPSQSGFDGDEGEVFVHVHGPLGETDVPVDQVRGVAFSRDTSVPPGDEQEFKPSLWIGLRDGSLIGAESIAGEGEQVHLKSGVIGSVPIPISEIASLHAEGRRLTYLTDLDAASYRNEPYLDLEWPYQRNRNVLGTTAIVGGRQYSNTLGMHSASRLTFDLDGSHNRFAASVGIDDAAEGRGSVLFRVFLNSGGKWREAYASGVVRGGEPAREVAVDLDGAKQLALVVDYADRGDERDYADWLDARLERALSE